MDASTAKTVTLLLDELQAGGEGASERLAAILYAELREIAGRYMRSERPDHTLQPTALVHEAFLRVANQRAVRWKNRAHFLGVAASAMRRILVDHARKRATAKRGGGGLRVTLWESSAEEGTPALDLLALDQAIAGLATHDERKARVVELRFFGGLEFEEIAEVLEISTVTARRDWRFARAWLARCLGDESGEKPPLTPS